MKGRFMIDLYTWTAPNGRKISISSISATSTGTETCRLLDGYDLLGAFDTFRAKFAKRYANMARIATDAFAEYAAEVHSSAFPDADHSYTMKPEEAERFADLLADGG